MRAGPLDKRIRIQKRVRTRDPSTGELVDGWQTIGKLWAELLDARAVERYVSKQEIAATDASFRVRANPGLKGITPDEHRCLYGKVEFNIRGVVEIQRGQGALVMCTGRAEGLTGEGLPPDAG